MKRFLCLWFPNWPIQRIVAAEPALRKTHVVLFRRDPRRGQRVAAASPLAIRDGVQIDMPISEVKQLLRRAGKQTAIWRPSHRQHPRTQHKELAKHAVGLACAGNPIQEPAVPATPANETSAKATPASATENSRLESLCHILEHDPVADRKAMEALADSLHCFSPIVGVEQTGNPESCFLDVTGLADLFGGESLLQTKAVRFLADQGYVVFSSIADSIGMAWGMAHYHPGASPNCALPAQADSDDPHVFSSLPIAALRLSPGTCETLVRLGIERIDQVLQIPRAHLTSRFGDEVSLRIDQAVGRIEEPISARHLPAEFESSQFIEFPTRDRETIGVILDRLLQQICEQLSSNQKGALQWHVQLDCVDAPSLEFKVNLFQPTATVSHVLQLMELQLESVLKPHLRRQRFDNKSPAKSSKQTNTRRTVTNILVQEISVRVTSCVLLVHRQRELFDESPRLDKQELAHLINHLTGRLGQESIVYPVLESGAQPEFSFRFKPLVDPQGMRSRKRKRARESSHRMARPFRLLENAVEIAAASSLVSDTETQQPPQSPESFLYLGLRRNVVRSWGPERIETGWWRGPTVRRDYWRIETTTGEHFWVYLDLRRRKWFLQGEF